jgi:hypothetical protein
MGILLLATGEVMPRGRKPDPAPAQNVGQLEQEQALAKLEQLTLHASDEVLAEDDGLAPLTPPQRRLVEALFQIDLNDSVEHAARLAGFPTAAHAGVAQSKPKFKEAMRARVEREVVLLSRMAPKVLRQILTDPRVSGKVKLDAVIAILDRIGLKPPERVEVKPQSHIEIDLRD